MARCIIFCAGGFAGLVDPIRPDDYILAADGGLSHTEALGLTPDGILGDFDSLGYVPEGAKLFPVEKDDTDAMLAVRKGLELGYKEFLLYGSLDGPRLDHTVANFQTLQFLADRGAKGYLIGKEQIVTLLKDGSVSFPKTASGYISLFCMGQDARGVTLENLKYPLFDATLTAGFPLGVSNQFVGKPATVSVREGSLLIIYGRSLWNTED
ncbi:MAG: thiamine diphosphokinase [Oscillospiraceae bacterium]|nr:thiamine diphosphokinase [Oscillospiraceae bacterium]MBQ7341615.1 thiamine diphosphokinase [Oscillospiraceae bacterium]